MKSHTTSLQRYFVFILCCLIFGCTATFNWREIRSDDQGYVALFPAKTSMEQQTISYESHSLVMTMEAASAGDTLFAVGTILLDKEVDAEKLITWMELNAKQVIRSEKTPDSLKYRVKSSGDSPATLNGRGLNLIGIGPDSHYRMYWVRWVLRTDTTGKSRIYQLSAITPFNKFPNADEMQRIEEQYNTFLEGFHPN